MMKKKIDVELKVIAEYLKKQLNLYQARGIVFEINDNGNKLTFDEDMINKACNYSGMLPLFTVEIDRVYKEITKDENGLPFVYIESKTAALERLVEISENIDLSKKAILTQSLAFLDYSLEDRVKKSYEEKYGKQEALNAFNQKLPVNVNLIDLCITFELQNKNNELIIYPEPKEQRINNLKKDTPKNTPKNTNVK